MTSNTPVVGLVVPTITLDAASEWEREITEIVVGCTGVETSGAHPDKRPNRLRTRGPGEGKRAECVLLLDIAIQALRTAKERALGVTADMPMHERVRLLVPVLSDAGLAMRSVEEAVERWEAGKV